MIMSNKEIWNQSHFTLSDVPRLQELLIVCDQRLLERVILEEFAHINSSVGKKNHQAARKRLSASLRVMHKLKLAKKTHRRCVLMPKESFVFNGPTGLIERRIDAELVPLRHSAALKKMLRVAQGRGAPRVFTRRNAPWENAPFRLNPAGVTQVFSGASVDARSYRLSFWEDTLACRIWLGGPWCRRERYIMLARVFWEMTYFGFEYDVAHCRIEQERIAFVQDWRTPQYVGGCVHPKARFSLEECDYGLREPDHFESDFHNRIEERISAMNRTANCEFLKQRLDLAHRLEGR